MPNTIRILLRPCPARDAVGLAQSPMSVDGVDIDAAIFGADMSNTLKDTPLAASIQLKVRLFKSVRGEPESLEEGVGQLDGVVSFGGAPPSHCERSYSTTASSG